MKQAMQPILFLNYYKENAWWIAMRFRKTIPYAAVPQINGSRITNRTIQMPAQSAITLHNKILSRFFVPSNGFFRNRTKSTMGGST